MKKDARKTCACVWGSRANPPTPDICFADFTSALFNPLRGYIEHCAFRHKILPYNEKKAGKRSLSGGIT